MQTQVAQAWAEAVQVNALRVRERRPPGGIPVMSPAHRGVVVWNLICVMFLLFLLVDLPIRLAFPMPVDAARDAIYLGVDWLISIFFITSFHQFINSFIIFILFITSFNSIFLTFIISSLTSVQSSIPFTLDPRHPGA